MLQLSYVHEIAFPIGLGHAQVDMGNVLSWRQTKRFHAYSTHVAEPSTPRLPFYFERRSFARIVSFFVGRKQRSSWQGKADVQGPTGSGLRSCHGTFADHLSCFRSWLDVRHARFFPFPVVAQPMPHPSLHRPPPWEKKLPVPRVLIACDGLNRHSCDRIPRSCAGFGSQACAIAPDLSLIASRGPNRLLVGRGRRLESPEAQK